MRLIFYSALLCVFLTFLTGHAWADQNMTIETSGMSPMFGTENIQNNTYSDTAYNFSILPPQGWILTSQGDNVDSTLVEFANENPDRQATFAMYYYQGNPISPQVLLTPDSQILDMSIAKLFDSSKFTIYQKHIQRFSDGFVIAALASKNDTTNTSPVIEEFSFWMNDGRQYFLVLVSSRDGFPQNSAEFEKSVYTFYVGPAPTDTRIPPWVKNNAKWWSEGTINDQNFANSVSYLLENKIIKIPPSASGTAKSSQIPTWVRAAAGWWSENEISDSDFAKALQYLIDIGLVNT